MHSTYYSHMLHCDMLNEESQTWTHLADVQKEILQDRQFKFETFLGKIGQVPVSANSFGLLVGN